MKIILTFWKKIVEKSINECAIFKRLTAEEMQRYISIFDNLDIRTSIQEEIQNILQTSSCTIKNMNLSDLKEEKKVNVDLKTYIREKFEFINVLRNTIMLDWNKKTSSKIVKLSQIKDGEMKKEKALKKNGCELQAKHLHLMLNNFLHSSIWLMWNEVHLQNIIKTIKKNYNFKFWVELKKLIFKISKRLKIIQKSKRKDFNTR